MWRSFDNPHFSTERLRKGLAFAAELHRHQDRKGTKIPYLVHLAAVAGIVALLGGNENQILGALFHDSAEDAGGLETINKIKNLFNDDVARIALGCSHNLEEQDFYTKKKAYIASLRDKEEDIILVSLADKIQNGASILFNLKSSGEAIWDQFSAGRQGYLWYLNQLKDTFDQIGPPLAAQLFHDIVNEINAETNQNSQTPAKVTT
ncbi:hypothetical protein BVY03_00725 [bacterium K02(2017)]|nr:hypothetical protein BVY03_00725 [bacterium K02(2017)]